MKKGKGIMIGEDTSSDKWRCPVCTFTNSVHSNVCVVCESQRDGGSND